MSGGVLDYALKYHDSGLSVLPVIEGTKRPAVAWKEFTERPQKRDELASLFANDRNNIGLVCGSVSRNLAVLDVDSREKWAELEKYPSFRRLKARSPVVKTYRGYHAYLYAPDPLATKTCPRWKADIKAENSYAVAPPSEVRHEHGERQLYLFSEGYFRPIYAPDDDDWKELQGLFGLVPYEIEAAELGASALFSDTPAGGVFYGLGRTAMNTLLNPHEVGARSEAEFKAVLRAVWIGWSFEDIAALFRRYAARGTKFCEKEALGYGEKWLFSCYKSAQKQFNAQVTQRWHDISRAIETLAHSTPFQERSRYTDAEVLRLILQIEREAGKRPVRASYRLLAERLGRPVSVVHDAMDRLREKSALIIDNGPDSVPMLTVPDTFIGLLAKPNNILHEIGGNGGEQVHTTGMVAGHDAYRRKALGPSGRNLVRLLNDWAAASFCVSDLMQKGFAYRYIERALSLLERAGIVEVAEIRKLKHGRPQKIFKARRIRLDDLDSIAELAGTKGEHERQKRRYREEREEYTARFSK